MLTEVAFRPPCLSYGPPPAAPEWLDLYNQGLQQFWNARRTFQIPTERYFSWLYRTVWDCDVTLTAVSRGDMDGNGIRQERRVLGVTKIGSINHARENKMAEFNNDGTIALVPNPNFNTEPNQYGTMPADWLMRQRHNPCVGSTGFSAYFTIQWRVTGQTIGSRDVEDPPITSWPEAPANASQIAISSRIKDDTRTFYVSYVLTQAMERTLSVQSAGTEIFATHYDPAENRIWPLLLFGGGPLTVNWDGLATPDVEQPASHPVTTTLTVDGEKIPAGTSWYPDGSSGQLSISVRWYPAYFRDL